MMRKKCCKYIHSYIRPTNMTHNSYTNSQSSLHQLSVIRGDINKCVTHKIIKHHVSAILTLH